MPGSAQQEYTFLLGTLFLVSYWRGDRRFTWSSKPPEGLAVCRATGTTFNPQYLSSPGLSALHSSALPTEFILPWQKHLVRDPHHHKQHHINVCWATGSTFTLDYWFGMGIEPATFHSAVKRFKTRAYPAAIIIISSIMINLCKATGSTLNPEYRTPGIEPMTSCYAVKCSTD